MLGAIAIHVDNFIYGCQEFLEIIKEIKSVFEIGQKHQHRWYEYHSEWTLDDPFPPKRLFEWSSHRNKLKGYKIISSNSRNKKGVKWKYSSLLLIGITSVSASDANLTDGGSDGLNVKSHVSLIYSSLIMWTWVSRYNKGIQGHQASLLWSFMIISGTRVGPLDYVPGRASTGGEGPHGPKRDTRRDDDLINYAWPH